MTSLPDLNVSRQDVLLSLERLVFCGQLLDIVYVNNRYLQKLRRLSAPRRVRHGNRTCVYLYHPTLWAYCVCATMSPGNQPYAYHNTIKDPTQ